MWHIIDIVVYSRQIVISHLHIVTFEFNFLLIKSIYFQGFKGLFRTSCFTTIHMAAARTRDSIEVKTALPKIGSNQKWVDCKRCLESHRRYFRVQMVSTYIVLRYGLRNWFFECMRKLMIFIRLVLKWNKMIQFMKKNTGFLAKQWFRNSATIGVDWFHCLSSSVEPSEFVSAKVHVEVFIF